MRRETLKETTVRKKEKKISEDPAAPRSRVGERLEAEGSAQKQKTTPWTFASS